MIELIALAGWFDAMTNVDAGVGYLLWPSDAVLDPFANDGRTTSDAALSRAVADLDELGGELLPDEDGWPGMDAGTVQGRRAWPFVIRAGRADVGALPELASWATFDHEVGLVPPVRVCAPLATPDPAQAARWRSSDHPAARALLALHDL